MEGSVKLKKSVRRRQQKEAEREAKMNSTEFTAKVREVPTPPRKMRLMADLIRNKPVNEALNIMKFSPQAGAPYMEKLILNAIDGWMNRHEDADVEEAGLFVKEVRVDGGRMLKRLRPAAQGRAHRIRKRSNHVTLVIDAMNPKVVTESKEETQTDEEE